MDIRQLQNEVLAIDLLAKYEPIIEKIMTLTEGVDVMSRDARLNWIDSHALKYRRRTSSWDSDIDLFFVEEFINETTKIPDSTLGLENDSLGRALLKDHSANAIIYACTYWVLYNTPSEEEQEVLLHGNPPLLKEEKKVEIADVDDNYPSTQEEKTNVIDGVLIIQESVTNVRAQYLKSTNLTDNSSTRGNATPIVPISELEKIIKGTPDFLVPIQYDKILDVRSYWGNKIDVDISDIVSELPRTSGAYIPDAQFGLRGDDLENLAWPIEFQLEGESVIVPNYITSFLKRMKSNDYQGDFRFFKIENGYIIDASEIELLDVEVELDGQMRMAKAKVIRNTYCYVFEGFNTYPAIFIKYDPQNPDAQPPTREEVQASQVEVLKLPNIVLARQMRVMYEGRKVPLSAASLDKWSKSNLSYGEAVDIMNFHLSFYTSLDKEGKRTNKGEIYEQTKNAVAKRLTDSKGKLNTSVFREVMSKYAFTAEETFFNLNPDFSDPEKLLGYFLGMGIQANNLHINQVNPYRILCARLLGIDYGVNYFDLCRDSVIAGHLFVNGFEENRPVFCTADVFLDGNFYAIEAKIKSPLYQKEITDFFGAEQGELVLESHEDLLREYSPKFMKLHYGTKQEYQNAVRNNGIGTPYKEDRTLEMTRMTLSAGLFAQADSLYDFNRSKYLEQEIYSLLIETPVLKNTQYGNQDVFSYVKEMMGEFPNSAFPDGTLAFQKYAATFDGASLYGRASNKLRYNDLDKETSIRRFYFDPKSARAGAHNLLKFGVTITNKELGDDGSERKTGILKMNWENIGKYKEPPKVDEEFVLKGLEQGQNESVLNDLGYKDKNKSLAQIIAQRVNGLYHEIASQARIEGDELYTLSLALSDEYMQNSENQVQAVEFAFNVKYNNYTLKPTNRIPIFLENNRTFGDIERFIATEYKADGSAAGFSLREAQRDGLRYLGAGGNSGLLAHEVGFGKTTSSIAKISDLFLRGDAKRVLISVPNPVYDSGNWEQEIQGLVNDDGRRVKNGLLPSNITLVKVGSMNKSDLLGKKIDSSSPEFAEKSEGTGYDGPMAYTKADLQLMEQLAGTTEGLMKIVGGAFSKYGKNKENSMLTPREQKHGYDTLENLWVEQNPFFKKSEPYKKSDIIRLNDTPRQTLAGLTTTIKSGDFDFWDVGDSDYMEFGKLEHINDPSFDSKSSFLKAVYEELKTKSPAIQFDEEEGGDLKRIMQKLISIHAKYEGKYKELTEQNLTITKQGRGTASAFGGHHAVFPKSVTDFYKKYPNVKQELEDIGYDSDILNRKNEMSDYPMVWIGVKTKEILDGNAKETSAAWWPYYGTRSFWERVVLPWAMKNHKNSSLETLIQAIEEEFPFTKSYTGLEGLAKAQLKTALELQMTEEVAFFFQTLSRQAPLFLGRFKEWTQRPNSVVLCSHLALPKLSVAQKFGEDSVDFMAGIYGNATPTQFLNARIPNRFKKSQLLVQTINNQQAQKKKGVRTRGQKEKLFLSQYRGLDINLLSCDAFIVDEVHNFNRAFKVVKKGTRVADKLMARGNVKDRPSDGGIVRANVVGGIRYPEAVYAYDTKANYNIRGEVQNFIAICLYFQDRGRIISEGLKRKIENTIFLSATPFTDDNFQMLSLFGALSTSKLMQGHVFNTFDLFQVYAKELWQKDIDYQNRYTLFPKIVGYKNIYALSQLIKSFTNFKISDAEIEAQRPQKVIVGTDAPTIEGVDKSDLEKVLSQVPFNEAQEKMNKDLNKYITLESDSELSYTQAELKKAEDIYEKVQKKEGKKVNPADEKVKELKALVKVTKRKGKPDDIEYEMENLDEMESLIVEIFGLDPENGFAKAVQNAIDGIDFEGAEGGDEPTATDVGIDDDDEEAISANAVKNEDDNLSQAQKIAQRALEASRTQQLTLISPYYLTINNDKNLMNPYLPALDGTASQNAKNVVENSPKLLYACKAIKKVLEYAVNEKGQTLAGENESEPIMGQVVYANNYKFRYHGKDFFLFDLMTQYIIDENKELLEQIVADSDRDVESLFKTIDGRTRDEKTQIVDDFNTGYCLVLFGTEIIKEGINLQKNCPLMYILQVGFVPVTYMQLHGRVWRQKNPYKYAFLINVLTQNSIDAFVYSKLEQKIKSVQQMLGEEVYDSEATQFDVDVAEIKINLITDPDKLAEMQWEDDEQELSRNVDRLTEELSLMRNLGAEYPEARRKYEEAIVKFNSFSQKVFDTETFILGKFFADKTNRRRLDVETQKLVDAQYPTQFPSDKVRDEFEENPNKFTDKDGKLKYENKADMSARLRKGVTITEMSDEEGREEVIELNEANDAEKDFKLTFTSPFNLDATSSLTAFVEQANKVETIARRCRQRTEKLERDQSREAMIEEYFDPAMKVAGVVPNSDGQALAQDLGVNGASRGQFALRGQTILHMACFKAFFEGVVELEYGRGKVDDFQVGKFVSRFRTGDEAITIGAFNDLVSNEQIKDGDTTRDATIYDLDVLLERKEVQKAEDQQRLDNDEESKAELRKSFAKKIAERQGETIPSVDERVEQLEAIFPYLERTR